MSAEFSSRRHTYQVTVEWTGNLGTGTGSYRSYSRDHLVHSEGKPDIVGSSDPGFRGDPARHNPEELLVAALSQCHMLWYLHLCAEAGVVVEAYVDSPRGLMEERSDGGGVFTEVVLYPDVTIDERSDPELAASLHAEANRKCFIAGSVAFPVRHQPTITRRERSDDG